MFLLNQKEKNCRVNNTLCVNVVLGLINLGAVPCTGEPVVCLCGWSSWELCAGRLCYSVGMQQLHKHSHRYKLEHRQCASWPLTHTSVKLGHVAAAAT